MLGGMFDTFVLRSRLDAFVFGALLCEALVFERSGLVLTRSCSARSHATSTCVCMGSRGSSSELRWVAGLRPDAAPAPEGVTSALHDARDRANVRVRGGRIQGRSARRSARPKRRAARDRPANRRSGELFALSKGAARARAAKPPPLLRALRFLRSDFVTKNLRVSATDAECVSQRPAYERRSRHPSLVDFVSYDRTS